MAFGSLRLVAFMALLSGAATPAHATVINHKLSITLTVKADGTSIQTTRAERIASNAATASQMAQWAIPFTPSLERLDIIEAYTQKRDGTRKPVEASAIKAQLPPGMAAVPMFSDIQEKIVIFPDLAEGDTEVVTIRREIFHPLFPGHFTWWTEFARNQAWSDVRIELNAPSSMKFKTDSIEVPMALTESADTTDYIWHYRSKPPVNEPYAIAPIDRRPRVFVSSFTGYDDLAASYAALSAPKAKVTPTIQAKADAITNGKQSHAAQAEALYDWVSQNIRYVALYLGRGTIEPHSAETVLANGYGDCKDHVALFAALLKAKGIDSQAVLINLTNAYQLSGPPTLAQLNHVITYIPELNLYADSTAGVAPFGVLPMAEYGKPAIRIGGPAPAQLRLPTITPDSNEITAVTRATLAQDGRITGTTITTATGPGSVALRLVGRILQSAGTRTPAERQLAALGETGTGDFNFRRPDQLEPSYTINASFQLEEQPGILEGDSFKPPVGLPPLVRPGDYFLGPMKLVSLPDTEPTPCFAGRQVENLSLELPPGRILARLPEERRISGPDFLYVATWSFADGIVSVRRDFHSYIKTPLCEGDVRRSAAEAFKAIRREQQTTIALKVD